MVYNEERAAYRQHNQAKKVRRTLGAAVVALAGVTAGISPPPLSSGVHAEQSVKHSPGVSNPGEYADLSQAQISPQQSRMIAQIGTRYGGYYSLVVNILNATTSHSVALDMVTYDKHGLTDGGLLSPAHAEQGLIDAQTTNNFKDFLTEEYKNLSNSSGNN